jgi:hypothetical protein
MALGFIFALVAFLAVSFILLAAYLAVHSERIRLSFGVPFIHAELEADKSRPVDQRLRQ